LFLFAVLVAAGWPVLVFAQDTGDGQTTPIDSLSSFALWAIVGGALTSVVTAVINRSHWRSDFKLVVFFALCCLTAAGDAYFKRELSWADWSRALVLVVASGWTTYLAARPAIKQIEVATG
jgi:drug/metabolite transporter (DMT)-like permease